MTEFLTSPVPKFTADQLLTMAECNENPGMFMFVDERAMKAAMRRGLVENGSEGIWHLTEAGEAWCKQKQGSLKAEKAGFRLIQGGKAD